MKIELKALSFKDNVDIYEMLQKIPIEENGYINRMNGSTIEEFKEWLVEEEKVALCTELIDGWMVPQTTYWL